ncbi:cytochrome c oxidase assembly factor 3 homolog, mitochondrial [Spea bombifrons]|uniref:cytochrome c oxidase assembly factor 3 homolog, mitochondrial n=1 Tax=Spea bombifrons TaxID=233779 RepID=UPI00234921F0|nr:cytochrome c oxidase assembly factor 3 homolog, mitochondrial [Spea bombifrons]
MAEKRNAQGSAVKYAQPIDSKRDKLNPEQVQFMRKAEIAQWGKNAGRLRSRNFITGLAIGGIVLGIYGYTFYSVSQEKFLDELENEAKVARANYPKTSAN